MAKKNPHVRELAKAASTLGIAARGFLLGLEEIFKKRERRDLLYVTSSAFAVPAAAEDGLMEVFDSRELARESLRLNFPQFPLQERVNFPIEVPVYMIFKAARLDGCTPLVDFWDNLDYLANAHQKNGGFLSLMWRDDLRKLPTLMGKEAQLNCWSMASGPGGDGQSRAQSVAHDYLVLYSFISAGVARGSLSW